MSLRVAINDLASPPHSAHLLQYDSVRGVLHCEVEVTEHEIILNGTRIQVFNAEDPQSLP